MKLAKKLIFKNILAVCVAAILFAAACSSDDSGDGGSDATPTTEDAVTAGAAKFSQSSRERLADTISAAATGGGFDLLDRR